MAEDDVFGLFETFIQMKAPGVDVSQLNDHALVLKVAHIQRIEKIEREQSDSLLFELLKQQR